MSLFFRAFAHVGKGFMAMMRQSLFFRISFIVSFVLVVAMILLPLWKLLPLGSEIDPRTGEAVAKSIPLHYNIYFGVDRFGVWYQVFVLPAIGLALFIINTVFQAVFYHREHVLSHFFSITTFIAELSLLVSMVFIILLNV